MNPGWKVEWQELRDVSLKETGSMDKVKSREAEVIRKAISDTDYVIALDERGKSHDSVSFAHLIRGVIQDKSIVFTIGGVYGLDKAIIDRADMHLSFSAFTFPHQLIRLILIEQLYRCQTIVSGKTYHY